MTPNPLEAALPELAIDAEQLFSEARDLFLESLSDGERSLYSKCPTSTALLEDLRTFAGFRQHHSRWSKPLAKLEIFANRLEPYFEIIGICIQSNPEWTAIAWGAIRLILKASSISKTCLF